MLGLKTKWVRKWIKTILDVSICSRKWYFQGRLNLAKKGYVRKEYRQSRRIRRKKEIRGEMLEYYDRHKVVCLALTIRVVEYLPSVNTLDS